MKHRVNERCKVLGAMKGVIKNRKLGMDIKRVLYEKAIVPTVTYGSELRGMKASKRQKMNAFEMKFLRSMAGVSRLDRLRNGELRERSRVRKELVARVDVNVLMWYGHVVRMNNERLTKRLWNAKMDGRK